MFDSLVILLYGISAEIWLLITVDCFYTPLNPFPPDYLEKGWQLPFISYFIAYFFNHLIFTQLSNRCILALSYGIIEAWIAFLRD